MSSPTQIADALQAHRDHLARLSLKSLALFGSGARSELRTESDVDFLYEFDEGAATLEGLLQLRALLEETLGRDVDLVPRKYVGPVLSRYLGEVVPVYPLST